MLCKGDLNYPYMKFTSFSGYWVARHAVMHFCTVDLLLGKFIGVSVLTGHVQQHYWYRIVGKFGRCIFILILKKVVALLFMCCIATFPNIYVLCNSVELFSVKQ